MLKINVRLVGESRTVDIEKGWSVRQLKEHLAEISGHDIEDLKIVFAGSVLPENLTIDQCDLGQHSVIHVLATTQHNGVQPSISSASVPATVERAQNIQSRGSSQRFFVYCKLICNKAHPGKLRVRCRDCKDGAFTLSRGPEGWHDVTKRNKIKGICNECDCDFAEFFFKCTGHDALGDARDEAIPLPQVGSNAFNSPCLGCMDILDPVLTFPCAEKHSMCLPCFSMFCRSKIRDRMLIHVEHPRHIGYTLCCPGGGDCESAYVEDIHHFRVAGNELYEIYQRFATEDLVIQSGGILCPGRGCGSGLFPELGLRRIVCEKRSGGCGLVFCRNCLQDYHYGDCNQLTTGTDAISTDYSVLAQNARKSRRDMEKCLKVIRETTKPCPGCKSATEKAGGCNHMTCQRCRFQWCWNCGIEWNSNCQGDHWFRILENNVTVLKVHNLNIRMDMSSEPCAFPVFN
ncbi:E3 ubiquitin-protein ligase parkin-like isoform X2 [Rhopilema esculentum]|uniref:E3 ubiquitin-protein ligase parkin-like isoform X2 n=1 Tax=Rhopilema esculentum TaxID=499914 RepID=UPI0031E20E8F